MGRTQAEIAEELGVGQKTVSRVLREQEIIQNIQNGHLAVLNNAKKGNDNAVVDSDPEPDGLNICRILLNPARLKKEMVDHRPGNIVESVRSGRC